MKTDSKKGRVVCPATAVLLGIKRCIQIEESSRSRFSKAYLRYEIMSKGMATWDEGIYDSLRSDEPSNRLDLAILAWHATNSQL